MLILLNTLIRRHRRRMSMALGVLALAGALVLAHGAVGGGHMGDSMGHPMSATIDAAPVGDVLEVCLAVAETAALGFGLLAAVGVWRAARVMFGAAPGCHLEHTISPVARPWPEARAGPADLQVFLR
ncbi:MAG: hypothetical protein ACSLFR_18315 [Solirubrobacteraceae bacterium]